MINLIYLDLSCLNLNHNGTNTLYALHNLIYLTHLDIHNTSLDNNSQYNTLYWLSTLTSLTYLNLANINYTACNIGSAVADNINTLKPSAIVAWEGRFTYYNNNGNYSITSIPCYVVNSNNIYYSLSLDSSGRAYTSANGGIYYYLANYRVCNIGSVYSGKSTTDVNGNSMYMTGENRFVYWIKDFSVMTTIPCYCNWRTTYLYPSLDSNGAAKSVWDDIPYYPIIYIYL